MIIENKINKEKLEDSIKLFLRQKLNIKIILNKIQFLFV